MGVGRTGKVGSRSWRRAPGGWRRGRLGCGPRLGSERRLAVQGAAARPWLRLRVGRAQRRVPRDPRCWCGARAERWGFAARQAPTLTRWNAGMVSTGSSSEGRGRRRKKLAKRPEVSGGGLRRCFRIDTRDEGLAGSGLRAFGALGFPFGPLLGAVFAPVAPALMPGSQTLAAVLGRFPRCCGS